MVAFLVLVCRVEAQELIVLTQKEANAFKKFVSTQSFDTRNVPIAIGAKDLRRISFSSGPANRITSNSEESLLKAIVQIKSETEDRRWVFYFTVSPPLKSTWTPSQQDDWADAIAARFITQYRIVEYVSAESGKTKRVLKERSRNKKGEQDAGGKRE